MDINSTIGINLWNIRHDKGITRDGLASLSGVSVAGIRRIEELQNDVKVTTLELLANALGIRITDLFNEVSEEKIPDRSKRYELQHKIRHALYPEQPANYHIFSLRLFLLYLPLFAPAALADALERLHGQCYGYEEYLLNQMQRLYDLIPNTPAKLYADAMGELDQPSAMQRQQDEVRSLMDDATFTEAQSEYTRALHSFLKRIDERFMCEVEDYDCVS